MFHFPPSLDRSTIGSLYNQKSKDSVECLIVQVLTQAMRGRLGVLLQPNDQQRLNDFVRAGSAE